MKSDHRLHWRSKVAAAGVLLAIMAFGALAPAGADPTNPKVYGKTFGEWSVAWWEWAAPIPLEESPILDQTGEFCHVGQDGSGKVWFLAGNAGGVTERTCTAPKNKALFFPILNYLGWPPDDGSNEEEIRASCGWNMDQAIGVSCTLDDAPCAAQHLIVRAQSPVFDLDENLLFGFPEGQEMLVSDGYWVMLSPLPEGEHVINFTGAVGDTSNCNLWFWVDITYNLTVE